MIKNLFLHGLLIGMAGVVTLTAAPLTLDFSAADPGSTITFNNNGTFGFPDASGHDFRITSVHNGAGTSLGLFGNIGTVPNQDFTIGTVTTSGPLETAPVAGSASFSIDDGVGNLLTGNLTFVDIVSVGATGGANFGATVNLSGITYSGTNADLVALAANDRGIVTATYQFGGATDLNTLKSVGGSTSYSGSITAVPEPLLSGLALLGINGLAMLYWKRREGDNS